jgi:hypothetical protein
MTQLFEKMLKKHREKQITITTQNANKVLSQDVNNIFKPKRNSELEN